jgi:hypothetical protein
MFDFSLNYKEAVELLNRAVAEKGEDFVYPANRSDPNTPACVYFAEGAPSCIIGHVLAYKGVPAEKMEGDPINAAPVVSLHIAQDDSTACLLIDAQINQDAGIPWGEAVALAVQHLQGA